MQHAFRRPVAPHSRQAYQTLTERLSRQPMPLVLDSFCGTGQSTAELARRHPEHLVVGIDQSAHRLEKHESSDACNYLLLRAEAEDIWQLLLADGHSAGYHYLFYPNPWPKAKHLQRRIHGHASFPWLLRLGGIIELRSNWQVYVEEFGTAMHMAGLRGCIDRISGDPAITLFEKKYRDSGHALWRCLLTVTKSS
ncbi:SAM-dependent methyltransferase [Halioglobus maricola]|uniref:tRNA (guanine(46)-N(7))-methyltransferase n=2 Tax=Halioglobus maricola TaxID=2601894 RepID=A0A5P9NR32_9GAMM|nr:SAM-dependent methyltransferase [Halioglobus maricola]